MAPRPGRRHVTAMLLLSVLLAALPVLPVPGAQGQVPDVGLLATTLEVEVTPPEDLVVPLEPFTMLPVKVRYTFTELAPSSRATEVTLEVAEVPPGVVVSLSPSELFFSPSQLPCGCQRTLEEEAVAIVSATMDAPAFTPQALTVQANASVNGAYGRSQGAGSTNVTAAFAGAVEATLSSPTVQAGPGALEVSMRVRAATNGPTRLAFEVPAPGLRGVEVAPPAAREVAPGGETNVTWSLLLEEGFEEGSVELAVAAAPAAEPGNVVDRAAPVLRLTRATGGGAGAGSGTGGTGGGGEPLQPTRLGAGGTGGGARAVDAGAGFASSLDRVGEDPASYIVPVVMAPFGLVVFATAVYAWRRADAP